MKQELESLLAKNFAFFEKKLESDLNLFKEIKLIDELNPGLVKSLGWVECFYLCAYIPIDKAVPIFDTLVNFNKKAEPTAFVYKEYLHNIGKSHIYQNEENNTYFFALTEPAIHLWRNVNDNKLMTVAQSSVKKLFTTNVARSNKFYSAFDTGFVEHTGADKKAFVVPNGECFGVEIEMLFADVFGKLRFSLWVKNNYPSWICERDGSLEDRGEAGICGLELVSPPLDINTLNSQLKVICAEALKQGGRGHDAGIWYGMHINVNIHGNNRDKTAAKFICLINDPKLRSFWQKICRRRGASVERYCQFQNVNLADCLSTEAEDHYRAVFYRSGKNCAEVRIFRSNLRHLTISVSVEILKHTLDFCMSNNKHDDYTKYREYLLNYGSSDLQGYLYNMKAMADLDLLISSVNQSQHQVEIEKYIA